MYHYFVKRAGKQPLIVGYEEEVNISLNPDFQRFTEEQEAFFEQHPTLSSIDIMNLREPQAVQEPQSEPLEDVKARAKYELSQKSLDTLGNFVQEYQFVNALVSHYLCDNADADKPQSTIYPLSKAENIILTYNRVGIDLRNIYKEAEAAIDAAETHQQVEALETQYTKIYDEYNDNNAEE